MWIGFGLHTKCTLDLRPRQIGIKITSFVNFTKKKGAAKDAFTSNFSFHVKNKLLGENRNCGLSWISATITDVWVPSVCPAQQQLIITLPPFWHRLDRSRAGKPPESLHVADQFHLNFPSSFPIFHRNVHHVGSMTFSKKNPNSFHQIFPKGSTSFPGHLMTFSILPGGRSGHRPSAGGACGARGHSDPCGRASSDACGRSGMVRDGWALNLKHVS